MIYSSKCAAQVAHDVSELSSLRQGADKIWHKLHVNGLCLHRWNLLVLRSWPLHREGRDPEHKLRVHDPCVHMFWKNVQARAVDERVPILGHSPVTWTVPAEAAAGKLLLAVLSQSPKYDALDFPIEALPCDLDCPCRGRCRQFAAVCPFKRRTA